MSIRYCDNCDINEAKYVTKKGLAVCEFCELLYPEEKMRILENFEELVL